MNKSDTYIAFGEWEDNCEELTTEEKGKMWDALFAYWRRGEKPSFSDRFMRACWRPIQQAIDRANEAYEAKCEKNRENGKRGGRPKKEESEKANGYFGFSEKTQKTLPDRDRDRDRDPERGRGRERDREAVAAPPRTTLTTTTSEEIVSSWNDVPCTNDISSALFPDQRRDRTEMAMAICGGLAQFLQLISGLEAQAYFKDCDVDYDWFVEPKNFQNILEGKYKEPRKKKKEGWE